MSELFGRVGAIEPEGWPRPKGYSNGWAVRNEARLVFVAGQIAWDGEKGLVGPGDFVAQFRRALQNVVAVVRAAGGEPIHIASLTIYVTDKQAYLGSQKELGVAWREVAGRHYPAITLVEVAGLVEEGALVEIQGIAAL